MQSRIVSWLTMDFPRSDTTRHVTLQAAASSDSLISTLRLDRILGHDARAMSQRQKHAMCCQEGRQTPALRMSHSEKKAKEIKG